MDGDANAIIRSATLAVARRWLIIDSDCVHRERLAHELRAFTHQEVQTAPSFEDYLSLGQLEPCLLVVCMDERDTLSLLQKIRSQCASSTLILIGYLSALSAFYAAQAGADAFAPKPVSGQQLSELVTGSAANEACFVELPSLARAEWEYLHSVLGWCRGNRSEAARRLKVHRSVLQRKLSRTPPIR